MSNTHTEYRAVFFTLTSDGESFVRFASLRNSIFVEQEKWQLPVEDGLETDQCDHYWAKYCILYRQEKPIGGFRAIRCDKPYLLATVFPHMAPDTGFPTSATMWEISRFGVLKEAPAMSGMVLYGLMFHMAMSVEATHLIALADPFHERLLRRMGVSTARFGEVQSVGLTSSGQQIPAVAGRIPIVPQQPKLQSIFEPLLEKVQIHDHQHVQRSDRVSA